MLLVVFRDYIPKQRKVCEIPADVGLVGSNGDGVTIAGYELEEFIGAGSFGSVHSGRNVRTNEKVAVKILDLDKQLRISDVVSLEQEIRAMKVLSHPNLVRLVDVMRSRRHVCIVMAHVSGGNCFQYLLENAPLDLPILRRIFGGLSRGVAAMSARNWCHRDIKPENTLLTAQGEAVLVDLGLCTKSTPGEMIREVCGTNGFMSPELNSGRPFDPMPTDVWSLGATLVELLCGNATVSALLDISPDSAEEKLGALRRIINSKSPPWTLTETGDAESCFDLITQTLVPDARLRLSASRVCEHPFLAGANVGASQSQACFGSGTTRPRSGSGGRQGSSHPRQGSAYRSHNSSKTGEPSSPLSPSPWPSNGSCRPPSSHAHSRKESPVVPAPPDKWVSPLMVRSASAGQLPGILPTIGR